MLLPIASIWMGFRKDFLGILTRPLPLIESRLPHITIEEAKGYILAQELRLRKYTRLESSSNCFMPTVNLTQVCTSHSIESENSNLYSDTNILYTNQYSSDSRGSGGRSGGGFMLELGLSLLSHASLPLSFWDHAFQTAVYLINRLPSASLKFDIPYTVLFHTIPDYQFLRVFGCSCFPFLRPCHSHKLEFRFS